MEHGQELTWAVLSSQTQKTLRVLQRGSCPSLQGMRMCLCGSSRAQGCPPVLGASLHPVLPRGDVAVPSGPTGCPLVIRPMLPPSAVSLSAGHVAGGTTQLPAMDGQQGRDAAGVISFLRGFWGAASCVCGR